MKKIIKLLSAVLCMALLLNSGTAVAYANEDDYFSNEQKEYYASLGLQGTTINV